MTDDTPNAGQPDGDMAEYLQTFLDETEEQLDDLVETMLALERDATKQEDLNEAFRLIHSIKGSAGLMGFDNITVLTHHLESRFERFRSGVGRLDEPTMNLVLRCIDFLRQCTNRLRDGEQLTCSTELLDELRQFEEQTETSETGEPHSRSNESQDTVPDVTQEESSDVPDQQHVGDASIRMIVRFRAGLQLADLKAQLIIFRLSALGEVKSTRPEQDRLGDAEQLDEFEVVLVTDEDLDRLRAAADVDGVEAVLFGDSFPGSASDFMEEETTHRTLLTVPPEMLEETATPGETPSAIHAAPSPPHDASDQAPVHTASEPEVEPSTPASSPERKAPEAVPTASGTATTKVAETMRVDIDRLDNLMNLAGELVVNRARFVQISGQISPALRKASMLDRVRDFSDGLRRTIESMENLDDAGGLWSAQIQQLRAGLEFMDEQSEIFDNGRRCFSQLDEAIDQLARVSHGLQRSVLETRMVPVGPLFNRFKRVVRDLSKERGKQVQLLIRGEKTELDKRMIDQLGDPLVHLVRNSIDHGLELPQVRTDRGKPEGGTITLEASHSGNNVYIHIRDDGGGIDIDKIRARLIDNRILSEAVVDGLPDEQALDYIWHPGFSTASEVTDVSGRGVGMDVVKTRINQLSGTVQVDSTPQQGTTFTIRLPLTLAIMNCLLVRLRNTVYSMPMEEVCEIVSVQESDVVTIRGRQTFEVRDEFLPLVRIDDIFQWHDIDFGCYAQMKQTPSPEPTRNTLEVVVLQNGGRSMGLRVDELLGNQDIVIKSLSDNFINIGGLSGASILGDGSVCLMLDVGAAIDMATQQSATVKTEEAVI